MVGRRYYPEQVLKNAKNRLYPVATFTLPENCWTDNFCSSKTRQEEFLKKLRGIKPLRILSHLRGGIYANTWLGNLSDANMQEWPETIQKAIAGSYILSKNLILLSGILHWEN